jgi:hypothetical protein
MPSFIFSKCTNLLIRGRLVGSLEIADIPQQTVPSVYILGLRMARDARVAGGEGGTCWGTEEADTTDPGSLAAEPDRCGTVWASVWLQQMLCVRETAQKILTRQTRQGTGQAYVQTRHEASGRQAGVQTTHDWAPRDPRRIHPIPRQILAIPRWILAGNPPRVLCYCLLP